MTGNNIGAAEDDERVIQRGGVFQHSLTTVICERQRGACTAVALDRLHVHRDYQRMGMATAICDALESNCKARPLVTYASITAKPFFEARGYEVWQENWVERRSIILKNYRMEKMK